ncbi:unnamed protein product [Bursaphelenchus okinawaensis]|uniref:Uncharacterized protein n=1 Tax=Bursaphelenchus okinawaensis TaxID=465554 RepID=A0A811KGB6_9BILA|nr:unnamed protein product [Bursaphelenchus okinawaensis]CAG9102598.1 unnamed protein product [Bursaphelenchus okinawaensis]
MSDVPYGEKGKVGEGERSIKCSERPETIAAAQDTTHQSLHTKQPVSIAQSVPLYLKVPTTTSSITRTRPSSVRLRILQKPTTTSTLSPTTSSSLVSPFTSSGKTLPTTSAASGFPTTSTALDTPTTPPVHQLTEVIIHLQSNPHDSVAIQPSLLPKKVQSSQELAPEQRKRLDSAERKLGTSTSPVFYRSRPRAATDPYKVKPIISLDLEDLKGSRDSEGKEEGLKSLSGAYRNISGSEGNTNIDKGFTESHKFNTEEKKCSDNQYQPSEAHNKTRRPTLEQIDPFQHISIDIPEENGDSRQFTRRKNPNDDSEAYREKPPQKLSKPQLYGNRPVDVTSVQSINPEELLHRQVESSEPEKLQILKPPPYQNPTPWLQVTPVSDSDSITEAESDIEKFLENLANSRRPSNLSSFENSRPSTFSYLKPAHRSESVSPSLSTQSRRILKDSGDKKRKQRSVSVASYSTRRRVSTTPTTFSLPTNLRKQSVAVESEKEGEDKEVRVS